MDVFSLLSYINKISLVAFFITTVAVGYQLYVLRKEKSKDQAPTIPDFKESNGVSTVANYTSLPSSLTKKETKKVNYSKLIFLVISLLTIIIIIVVVSLISRNYKTNKADTGNNPPTAITKKISPTPVTSTLTPTPLVESIISPEESPTIDPTIEPTLEPTVEEPTVEPTTIPSAEPTEIILASNPTLIPEDINPTETQVSLDQVTVLPETGNLGKGILIIGAAISAIFFSFWF